MSEAQHAELNTLLQSLIFAAKSPAVIVGETHEPMFYADKIRELFAARPASASSEEP